MHLRPLTNALAVLFLAATAAGTFAGSASAKPSTPSGDVVIQSCPQGAVNRDARSGQFFDDNAVNIRTGPSTACTSRGQGQLSHNVDYWCWASGQTITRGGETWSTWTFLRDTTTGVQGWSSDAYLDFRDGTRGSNQAC
jgi:hypothetical protein